MRELKSRRRGSYERTQRRLFDEGKGEGKEEVNVIPIMRECHPRRFILIILNK